jgi:hypothetical protein
MVKMGVVLLIEQTISFFSPSLFSKVSSVDKKKKSFYYFFLFFLKFYYKMIVFLPLLR